MKVMPTTRAWDEYDAYLFDIDGTMLNCADAVHYFAFCDTLTMLAGKPMNLDGVVAHGNVDVGIMRDAFQRAGVEDAVWRPRLAEARAALGAAVERGRGDLQITVLPDVVRVLQHLRARGAVLGVATGNLELIGRTKLQHCGLLQYFDFGGYSDDCETRSDVFRAAVGKARDLAGAEASICVFGDTPADVIAALQNGLDVIAVGTGIFPEAELRKERPTRYISSLTELFAPVGS